MANPNLVRKPSDSPTGGAGEVTPAQILDTAPNDQNYVINGAFDYWQRSFSQLVAGEQNGPADRWAFGRVGTSVGTMTVARSFDVPSNGKAIASASIVVGTAAPSLGVNDRYGIFQKIEGSVIAPLYNEKITLSFWVKSSVTGTYTMWVGNGAAANGFYISSYVINSANTWEQKNITVDLSAKVGTWAIDGSIGMYVYFGLAAGATTATATPNVWTSSSAALAVAGQVNFMATSGNTFLISQVMLNRGSTAAPFLRAGRNQIGELVMCQRYYEKSVNIGTIPGSNLSPTGDAILHDGGGINGGAFVVNQFFKVNKRTLPTCTIWSDQGVAGVVRGNATGNISAGVANFKETGFGVAFNLNGTAQAYNFQWVADAEL